MHKLAPIAVAMMCALPAVAVQAQEADQSAAGVAAAEAWFVLADAGEGAQSWNAAGADFRRAVSQDQWAAALQAVRAPLGAVKSRKLVRAQPARTLQGLPDGEHVVLQYQTVYANRAGVGETVVATRQADGSWKMNTYRIQ